MRTTFSSLVDFRDATFSGSAYFWGATFSGAAHFLDAIFSGAADFQGATFFSLVDFRDATFSGKVDFHDTTFSGDVSFWNATFSGDAYFWDATFSGNAYFWDATFPGIAYFWGATFSKRASFRLSTFEKSVAFSGAVFKYDADFSAIESRKFFNLRGAFFHVVPDFSEAAFHAPPVLDDVRIKDQLRGKRGRVFKFRCLPDVTPAKAREVARRFRALGKMAHEARDWLNEMEFFAQEIRVRRFGLDFPLGEWRGLRKGLAWAARKGRAKPLRRLALGVARRIKASPWCGPHVGRFWFGLLYEKLSDFGRSFARPLVGWVVLTLLFALLYAGLADESGQWSLWDPLYISVRHGLVVGGLVRTGHMQDVLASMFGQMSSWLALVMMAQTVLSAFFLFLFFLAVRNHFRIR